MCSYDKPLPEISWLVATAAVCWAVATALCYCCCNMITRLAVDLDVLFECSCFARMKLNA
jgi:hypothetical protein